MQPTERTTSTEDLCFRPATELVAMIKAKQLSARELLQAHLTQIERVNPKVNAIITLVADEAMTAAALADEATARGNRLGALQLFNQATELFQRYEYFVLPVTQVAPFDVTIPYPTEIGGTPMKKYIDWMRSCWYVSFMTNPAISVPAGFTNAGLPVGIQIVGRARHEWSVLQMAHAFEQATMHGTKRPAIAG